MTAEDHKGNRKPTPTPQMQQLNPWLWLKVLSCIALVLLVYSTCWYPSSPTQSFLTVSSSKSASESFQQGCLVIVHLGDGKPIAGIPIQQSGQITDNIEQLRLFNPDLPVHLIVSDTLQFTASEVVRLQNAKTVLTIANSLAPTPEHNRWQKDSALAGNKDRNNFWRFTSERFFYLSDLAVQHNLADIIHIEYDNLVYADVSNFIPTLRQYYSIGAVFDSPTRCIPGFMYFRTSNDVLQLAEYMSQQAGQSMNDMQAIGLYRKDHPERILPLPIFDPATYPDPIDPSFATHLQELGRVFDGAAYGQYIGGVDPRNIPGNTTGFVNEECVVKPNKMNITWSKENGLWVPYANQQRITNLHIHSKNTKRWRSDRTHARMLMFH